jgi:hypothetical protein
MIKQALSYAALGWRVFPCHAPDHRGRCSCDDPRCESVGKHPRTRRGVHDATMDPDTITRWGARWPNMNIGIATGNGLVVLDVDPRHGGDESLAELEHEHGDLITLTARTGGGGIHLYLAGELPGRIAFRPGLDLKAAGGYVIAPPSLHVSGHRYEWIALGDLPTVPQPVPRWLERAVAPPPPAYVPSSYLGGHRLRPRGPRYVAAAIEAECVALASAPKGERNTTLNRAAYTLGRFIAAGDADAGAVRQALSLAGRHTGLTDTEIRKTVDSAFGARSA